MSGYELIYHTGPSTAILCISLLPFENECVFDIAVNDKRIQISLLNNHLDV